MSGPTTTSKSFAAVSWHWIGVGALLIVLLAGGHQAKALDLGKQRTFKYVCGELTNSAPN